MAVIAPCITVETVEDYQASIDRIRPFAERVHIDVSDGEFAPRKLIDVTSLFWPEAWTVDVHVMMKRPREALQYLISYKPHTIVLHAEADEEIVPLLTYIRDNGVRAGVALLRGTVPSAVAEAIKHSDYVMIFSGDLGHYGGTANMMQLEKVRLIRAIKADVEIAWDGGVSVENAYNLMQGGVDVLNAGGAINKSEDPRAAYNQLVSEINRQSSFM